MSNTRTASRPDDKPFDFDLDALKAEVDLTPFVFQWQGRRWSLAHLQELDAWESIEAAEQGDAEAMLGTFRLGLGDGDWAAFRSTPVPQFKLKGLFMAYLKHCGMKPGESPASTDS